MLAFKVEFDVHLQWLMKVQVEKGDKTGNTHTEKRKWSSRDRRWNFKAESGGYTEKYSELWKNNSQAFKNDWKKQNLQ